MIVFTGRHLLRQIVQLEILRLEVELWSHEIVAVSLVSLREFHLVYFVLDH